MPERRASAQRADFTFRIGELTTEDLRIGVYVCDCGSNIARMVDTEELREYAETLPGVILSVRNKYMCADPGQQEIQRTIYENNLNRIVVASCSPASCPAWSFR